MSIERNFIKRVNDIQESFLLISFIANIESHRNQPILNADNGMKFYVTQEMQCGLKAQFLIVLYNIVESTVCDCLTQLQQALSAIWLFYSGFAFWDLVVGTTDFSVGRRCRLDGVLFEWDVVVFEGSVDYGGLVGGI